MYLRSLIALATLVAFSSLAVAETPAQTGSMTGSAAVAAVPLNAPQAQTPPDRTPMKVTVTVSRFDNDRRVANTPYTVVVTSGLQGSLRMGSRVPVRNTQMSVDGKLFPAIQYVDVGTNMDVTITPAEGGQYRVTLAFVEATMLEVAVAGNRLTQAEPTFRNFSYSSSLMLKEGESKQIASSVDKTTGEVIRLEVSLSPDR